MDIFLTLPTLSRQHLILLIEHYQSNNNNSSHILLTKADGVSVRQQIRRISLVIFGGQEL